MNYDYKMMKTTTISPSISIPVPEISTGFFDFSVPSKEEKAFISQMPPQEQIGLFEWTRDKRKFLGPSRPFDIRRHWYLQEIYECTAKEIHLMKAAQMGASELLISYAAHVADVRNGNTLYMMPTTEMVSDFSTSRLGPAIEASPYLASIVVGGSGAGGMRGSDRIMLKRIRDRFIFFRGGKVGVDGRAAQLKSMPCDCLLADELDEMDPRALPIARKRLGHAKEDINVVMLVSTPSYIGVGIHAEWLRSDQRLWNVKCEHCNEWQSLEIGMCVYEWDSLGRPSLWHGKEDYTAWLACTKCGKALDRLQKGQWVVTYPERPIVGYSLSKLFSAQMDLLDVVLDLDTTDQSKLQESWNQNLGLPFIPKGGNLDTETLDNCRRQYTHGPDLYTSTVMGIDVGRVLHCVVRSSANFETGETRQLYANEVSWDELDRLMKIYRPRTVTIDALPETTKAREFQDKYGRIVWLAYYPNMPQGNKRQDFAVWDVKERKVMIDRTRSLDSMFAGFYAGTSTLPHHARNIKDYYDQMRSLIRITKEDATGQEVIRYIENSADHYAHAENYANISAKCRIGFGWSEGASG